MWVWGFKLTRVLVARLRYRFNEILKEMNLSAFLMIVGLRMFFNSSSLSCGSVTSVDINAVYYSFFIRLP